MGVSLLSGSWAATRPSALLWTNQTAQPLLPWPRRLLYEKRAAPPSFLHCNYCFTIECLNNGLQILCIYANCKTHLQWLGTSCCPQKVVVGLEFVLLQTWVGFAMQFGLVCPQLLQGASGHSTGCSCRPGRHRLTLHPLVASGKTQFHLPPSWEVVQAQRPCELQPLPSPIAHHSICALV